MVVCGVGNACVVAVRGVGVNTLVLGWNIDLVCEVDKVV